MLVFSRVSYIKHADLHGLPGVLKAVSDLPTSLFSDALVRIRLRVIMHSVLNGRL